MFKALTAGIRAQLRLAFAIVIAILSTDLAIYRLGEPAQNTKDITALLLAKERAIAAWLVNTSTATKRVAAVARLVDPNLTACFAKESKASTEVSGQLQAQAKALLSTNDEKAMFATIGTLRQRYLDECEAIINLKASGKNDAARAMFDETFDRHTIDYVSHLKQMLTMQERAIDGQAKHIGNDADRAKVPLSLVCAVIVAVSIAWQRYLPTLCFVAWAVNRQRRPSSWLKLHRSNLNARIALACGEEHSVLTHTKPMRDSLARMVIEVRTSTANIRQPADFDRQRSAEPIRTQ